MTGAIAIIMCAVVFVAVMVFFCAIAGGNGKDEDSATATKDQITRERFQDARRMVWHMGIDPDSPTGITFVAKYMEMFNDKNEEENAD